MFLLREPRPCGSRERAIECLANHFGTRAVFTPVERNDTLEIESPAITTGVRTALGTRDWRRVWRTDGTMALREFQKKKKQ